MSSMVEIKNLHWRYPSFGDVAQNPWCLKGINLEIKKGEFFGITGPSGAGKTTTCKAIVGVIPHGLKIPFRNYNHHLKGEVIVDGELVTGVNPEGNIVDDRAFGELEGKGVLAPTVGMVLQDPETQFLKMSVLHEVSFGLQMLKMPADEIEGRVRSALDMVGLGFLQVLHQPRAHADLAGHVQRNGDIEQDHLAAES